MLICLADSTPALQSRSNLDSVISFALACSCSFGVVVSFFIQIHISFHKNIPFLTSFSSFFGIRLRKRGYSSLYCSDFHILVLIHNTEKTSHPIIIHSSWIVNCGFFLSFQKYYGFSLLRWNLCFHLLVRNNATNCETIFS